MAQRNRTKINKAKNGNTENLATQGAQDEEKRSKNTTQYALDTAMRKPTQARQTTEGKNEPNIVFMRKS
jgi:hypothetical protein